MSFVVSARKYRPINFEDVVGQSAITETLQHAIKNNQLAQAMLFCGPRGVGKTSCARILAREINKTNKTDFNNSFNIFELDAASNNSVDDIRALTEQVRYAPQEGKYKIYIIDEVHMLSNQAFNAFLKTLEEPPAHAIFILATTEKHKIIPTILSRCQIYDFKRISILDAKNHLKKIADAENINYEEDALYTIAQKADGAMRDALSTFDRMVTFTNNNLTLSLVAENLNVLDYDYYIQLTHHFLENNINKCMLTLHTILENGFDLHLFISGLGTHFRDLLMIKSTETVKLLELGEATKERYKELSLLCSNLFLLDAMEICNDIDKNLKNSKNQRLSIEVGLMKICSLILDSTENKKKSHKIKLKPSDVEIETIELQEIITVEVIEKPEPIVSVVEEIKAPQNLVVAKPFNKNIPKEGQIKNALSPIIDEKINANKLFVTEELPKDDFTLEKVLLIWQEFLTQLKETNNTAHNGLKETKIELSANNKDEIIFIYISLSSLQEFDNYRPKFIIKIKALLNNFSINIISKIEELKNFNLVVTKEDVYQQMAQNNPLLEKLREKLDLDIY